MGIKLANNATSRLAAPLAAPDTSISVLPGDGAKFPALSVGDYFMATIVNTAGLLEIVKCTARATDVFTVTRAQEGTTPRAFNAGDVIQSRFTAGSLQAAVDDATGPMSQQLDDMQEQLDDANTGLASKLNATGGVATDLSLEGSITEEVHALTGTAPALDPKNGTIQTWTLTGNSTPTAAEFLSGQAITLHINDGSAYSITWPSVVWVGGSAPSLATTGFTVFVLWKVGSTLYGVKTGEVA